MFTEVEELTAFVKKHLMVEYIITGEPQRAHRYDYPLDAIREIVLNMIVHRDYRDSSDSVIKIFDDRMEFYNPGGLYDDLTVEQLITNNYQSKTRNKLIAMMFKECGLIEKYGSGISRIKKLCADQGLKEPIFEEKHKGFKVTLYKKTTQETTQEPTQETTQETVRKLSTQDQMLALIEQNSKITRVELAAQIGVSENAIKQQIAKLKKAGRLHRIGSTKGGYWEVQK
nr:ATP-binding protein [Methylomarinum sp. Ch1-1]MDP4521086.1 ATP-binding protein [Methylomarinum sp. Ch1-1]